MKAMCSVEVITTAGRNSYVKSDNYVLDLYVRWPKAMGGASEDVASNSSTTLPNQVTAATARPAQRTACILSTR
ncbi:hypothetical protein [Maribacter antarcticus]|uniref:hypothetical protein n=1 Tax=Maribacter antarcticus TaxID=505250 RepID=UPI0004789221|nr:hypothetical protein [Maribacter antarcticus]